MSTPIRVSDMPAARIPGEPWSRRLFTGVSAAFDSSIVRAMQLVVEKILIPNPEDLAALRASAEGAFSDELREEPHRFFGFIDQQPIPREIERRFTGTLDGGTVSSIELESSYEPFGFDLDAPPTGRPILVERWVHRVRPARATMLTLHGFMMGNPRIDAYAMMAREWYRQGLDVALMTLPYHAARTAEGAAFSGDRFAVPHVALLAEAVREAIYEIQLVTRYLQQDSNRPVGLIGLSLGGYLASLFAGLSSDPDWVIPLVAPACIGDLAWRFFPKNRVAGSEIAESVGGDDDAPFTREELRHAYRVHSPLAHSLKIPRAHALIIGGRGDRIVPPEHPHSLWEHWGRPDIHWFSGSHLAPFGRRRVSQAIVGHLERIGIL